VLIIPEKKTIHILDVNDMQFSELLFTEPLLTAAWVGDKILYITHRGAFLTGNPENNLTIQIIGSDEEYLQGIKLSPDGRYLAIPGKKPYTGMLDAISLTIIDLKAIRNDLK
jgi:hypothetical protein